jgi:hypothetical protein
MGKLSNLRAFISGGGVELERKFVAGAAANTALNVAGLALGAELLSVVEWAAGVPTDRTSVASISAAGQIKVNDDTTGNTVEVLFAQRA